MKVIYSYNKIGFEADYWLREIASASTADCTFIPLNHGEFANPNTYIRAQLLDNLYHARDANLFRLYDHVRRLIHDFAADVLLVDNCFPYHPEFLLNLPVYKVIRTTDGPMSAYDRDFAYLHAYDHVLYHSPAYSEDMGMADKLRYCGAKRINFLPLGSFDALCDPNKSLEQLISQPRNIDVLFIGALHLNKMPLLAKVKKALGLKMKIYGLAGLKKNIYFNAKYGMPGWVKQIRFEDYVPLYQRAKIGINIHNRGDYTVGSYRLFDLPANGVMQISDGGPNLNEFFSVGKEIIGYTNADDLIDKVRYFLENPSDRQNCARAGLERVRKEYGIRTLLRQATILISGEI